MKSLLIFPMLFLCPFLNAQSFDVDSILTEEYAITKHIDNTWELLDDDIKLVVHVDSGEISISAFVDSASNVTKEEMFQMLRSHALNSGYGRYSVFGGVVWVFFDCPLESLYESYFLEALEQCKNLATSFRGDYSVLTAGN